MAKGARRKDNVRDVFLHWRQRRDEFWDGVLNSRYGPYLQVVFVILFVALGLILVFNTLDALSTGVVHGRRGGRIYLAEAPELFWAQFMWNLALGALPIGLVVLVVWLRFGTVRGRRNAAQRRRRAMKKLSVRD